MESRIQVTRQLVNALKAMSTDDRPEMFLSASAIGIYANSGTHDEEVFEYGHDFLGEVATRWEGAAAEVKNLGVRMVIMRIGLVLGRREECLVVYCPYSGWTWWHRGRRKARILIYPFG